MGRSAISLRWSYLWTLVLPAVLLNGLTLLLAWQETPMCDELLAEVEVLHELDSPANEHWYLVRVQRLVKGENRAPVLRVRLPGDVLPEGLGAAALRHVNGPFPTAGERIFVVLRRGQECLYSVEHFWLGAPARTAPVVTARGSSGAAVLAAA